VEKVEFYEVLGKRRTAREFQQKAVEKEKLTRIIEAGLKAPSHNHLREWEFIFVKDLNQRRKVVEIGAQAKDYVEKNELEEATRDMADQLQKEMYLKALSVQKKMLMSSPELLVVCFRMRKPLKECETLYDLNSFASVWACIENILLAMAAEGLFGVTYIPHRTKSVRELLGIPEDYEVAALIPIGYPSGQFMKQKTVVLSDKIHIDKW
jgi:nitroreductase